MGEKMKTNYKIGIIGAGRITYSLTPALIKAGYEIASVSSIQLSSAKALAKYNKLKYYTNIIADTVALSNVIFIAVPDSQIEITAKTISTFPGIKGKTFIHLSGSKNTGSLKPLEAKGAYVGGLHIMQSFPERKKESIKNCYASIEAPAKKTISLLKEIAAKIETVPFVIAGEEKIILHMMCVFASNFINADYYNAQLLYKKIKSKIPPIEKILYPLSCTNLNNIKTGGIIRSLSGPIARKDYDTVNDHLNKLFLMSKKEKDLENTLESYAIQTLALLMLSGKGKRKQADKRK
jgi:predicted short-subunit dehydrogenase-like oxidoreductase (DUF2520 family)